MDEKKIWKWIINSCSDEGIVEIVNNLGIPIPGFRHLNKDQDFKILRPRLAQVLLNSKNIKLLKKYFNTIENQEENIKNYKDKEINELLDLMKKEVEPSLLFSVLMSSQNNEHVEKAGKMFAQLEEQGKLAAFVHPREVETSLAKEEKKEDEELKLALQRIKDIEKKLKKSEQNMQTLNGQLAAKQKSLEKEKLLRKEDTKKLNQEIGLLRRENRKLQDSLTLTEKERINLSNKDAQYSETLKTKEAEISRLNALCLNLSKKTEPEAISLETETDLISEEQEEKKRKLKVALLGNPRNSKLSLNENFEIVIIEAENFEEQMEKNLFDLVDEIWILSYRTPLRIQKKIKKLFSGMNLFEFPTFIDLENYIERG